MDIHLLRIEVQVCAIDLIKPPEEIFGSSVGIVASRIVGEVAAEWRPSELRFEQIDFVQEKYYARSHKPSRVNHRVE